MVSIRYWTVFLACTMLVQCVAAAPPPPLTLEVDAGRYLRKNTPVSIGLPAQYNETWNFQLTRLDNNATVPIQRTPFRSNVRLFWILQDTLKAGEVRRYQLGPQPTSAINNPQVTCQFDNQHVVVKVGKLPVLQYNHAVIEAPKSLDPKYRRSGHIHPIYNPAGQSLTDDFPPDHAHQHGLFFPWVRTEYGKHSIDFWNQLGETGRIEHAKFLNKGVGGNVFGQFTVQLTHTDITDKQQPNIVLWDTRVVRVFNLRDYFLFDLESHQTCFTKTPLLVKQYHYGGLAIRGNRQWFKEQTADRVRTLLKSKPTAQQLAQFPVPRNYLTSEGKTWFDGNETRARWVEMHGDIDGKPAGITLMCHPGNFRAPQPVRLHPHKPYFCFAPMQLGDFEITLGGNFASRYRFYAHSGPVNAEESERLWQDYAEPPKVRVVAVGR